MPTITTDEERPVPLRAVDSEIARRVRALQEPGEAPLLRIRMSNLVIVCDDPTRAEVIARHVTELAAIHPARVLLLVSERNEQPLTATVAVRERLVTKNRTGAIEWITLRAGGSEAARLPYAVRQLLLGNLPTNVWWAGTTPVHQGGALLDDLAESVQVQQVLYDSQDWLEPAATLPAAVAWIDGFDRRPGPARAGWRVATDLNWRRLRTWRSLIAQALDPSAAPGSLESISAVRIVVGPGAAVQGWLIAGWLASRLGWRLVEGRTRADSAQSWQFEASRGQVSLCQSLAPDCPAELQAVGVTCHLEGQEVTLAFAPLNGCSLAVCRGETGCVPRTLTLTPEPLAELVGRQLSNRDFDPVFHASVVCSAALVRSALSAETR
jgi:glucose-6-phosphate dehydrogenase assembly protein OpcA